MAEIENDSVSSEDNENDVVLNNPTGNESEPVRATQVQTAATSLQTVEYLIYFFFGLLEILLAFRLILKLAGANATNVLVDFVYGVTGLFILPFEGIFRRGVAQGAETTSVLEPETLIALVVYALVSWGIVKLVHILSGEQQ